LLRPKNSISEGYEKAPLFCNSLLFTLAKLLSRNAFRDFSTIESLLEFVPPKDTRSYPIAWRDDLLEQPFFLGAGRNGSIETASAFHRRQKDAGIRACFPDPPTMHDWRANSLFLIGKYIAFYRVCDGVNNSLLRQVLLRI
jgi:hypothetical protein